MLSSWVRELATGLTAEDSGGCITDPDQMLINKRNSQELESTLDKTQKPI